MDWHAGIEGAANFPTARPPALWQTANGLQKRVYTHSVLFAAFKSAVASPMNWASDRYMLYLNAGTQRCEA